MRTKRTAGLLAGVAATAMLLGACDTAGDEETASEDTSAETDNGDAGQGADEGAGASGQPFGAACDAVPEDGDGSFDGMAQDPVATAASNNPVLSTLVTAVGEADLVDTLNGAEDITVFAPANDAFEAIPSEDLDALLADQDALTDVLTYHVVGERLTLEDLDDGEFETLQGSSVQTTADGENVTVDGDAQVVCGNVQTANATVYIIDSVLMP
ncbi:fasciclin domain-containing protein [Haloechinothrix sp. YIM 98757]|uniref:Fasciclin domain-containing protein n=1 Tax=Haloechinothrix aidingensis TaxID=2752311 RepID=A0A838AD33_9PSEU|nr:fasciclin domain-containing protein [Haloechinothrix aidingensis]MBA0127117.1 fasciclin domain-containing protein [Haloechinothrix aidingensis]